MHGGGCEGNVDGGNPWHGGIAGAAPGPGTATARVSGGGSRRSCVYKFCRVGSPASDPRGNWVNVAAGAVGSVVGAEQGLRCQFMPLLCPQALQAVGLPSEGDLYHDALGALGISSAGSDYTAGYIAASIGLAFIPGAGEEEAAAAADGAAARIADDAPAAACLGGLSFTPDTGVLLAGGKTAPISSLKPGDAVIATSTTAGKTTPEIITAVEVNHDTDLYDLRVKTARGVQVIHTTASHLFWDPYLHYWVPANKLSKGERLKTPDGTVATADGGTTPKVHDGWMWDLTVPGNNDHDFYVLPSPGGRAGSQHAYHVVAGGTPVLVHNCGKSQGVYIFDDLANPGKVYVGKTNNFARRLGFMLTMDASTTLRCHLHSYLRHGRRPIPG